VAPQCPPNTWWVEKADDLIALLNEIITIFVNLHRPWVDARKDKVGKKPKRVYRA
jgi:hypothetical protein